MTWLAMLNLALWILMLCWVLDRIKTHGGEVPPGALGLSQRQAPVEDWISPRRDMHPVAAHLVCPECGEEVPVSISGTEAVDGELHVLLDDSDVWAHSFTHDPPQDA